VPRDAPSLESSCYSPYRRAPPTPGATHINAGVRFGAVVVAWARSGAAVAAFPPLPALPLPPLSGLPPWPPVPLPASWDLGHDPGQSPREDPPRGKGPG